MQGIYAFVLTLQMELSMTINTSGETPSVRAPVGSDESASRPVWLTAGGEMGSRVAALDWASTPLGALESWTKALRQAVSMCLASLSPMSVRWGQELVEVYNDACREVYGADRFASALGKPSAQVWPEAEPQVREHLRDLLDDGLAYMTINRLVPLNRHGYLEGCYFTFSYTPLIDDSGKVAGVMTTFVETTDAQWTRAVITAMHDPLIIFDSTGRLLELNQAFTDLFGYSQEDGPFEPAYPWWPTAEEDPAGLERIQSWREYRAVNLRGVAEFQYYDRQRRPVWLSASFASIPGTTPGRPATICSFRDITLEKAARSRRASAAVVSAGLAAASDLESLLGVAQHGLELLFEGVSTIQLDIGDRYLFSGDHGVAAEYLDKDVRSGLDGLPSADTVNLRSGVLLMPQTSTTTCRAWIQFPHPRQVRPDELIVADLLAQAFGLAVDRMIGVQQATDRQTQLAESNKGQQIIGQAVGILVERHKMLPSQAFEQLRRASQTRNIKLRELAMRVIETGTEPEQAY